MKVLIVDDDKLVAFSLKTILEADGEISVPAMGSSGAEALVLYRSHKPDVLLMDIRMGEMSGLEAAELILAEDPEAKILFLTTFSDDEYIVKALLLGAKGYIFKQDYEAIVPALKTVCGGQSVFGSGVAGKIPKLMKTYKSPDYGAYGISEKEQSIIREVAQGRNNKEIAAKLYLSEGTVRNYISAILEKLELRDRTQLAVFYYKNSQKTRD